MCLLWVGAGVVVQTWVEEGVLEQLCFTLATNFKVVNHTRLPLERGAMVVLLLVQTKEW